MSGGDEVLVAAENFAEAALGAGAFDGVADGGVGGYDREAHGFRRDCGREVTGSRGGALAVPEHKAAAFVAAAIFPQVAEIALPPDVLLGAETHNDSSDSDSPVNRPRKSDDGQPFASGAAAVGENFASGFGGLAGAEANLARAFFAMWAECRLHDELTKINKKFPEDCGGCKAELEANYFHFCHEYCSVHADAREQGGVLHAVDDFFVGGAEGRQGAGQAGLVVGDEIIGAEA